MILLLAIPFSASQSRPEVTVATGALRGIWEPGGDVASFRDIPYASAERFGAPQPPASWSGVRDAGAFGPGCAQRGSNARNPDVPALMSEDCQRLNVYTPSSALQGGGALAPVMVWWHGGAYSEGSSFGPFDLYDSTNVTRTGGVVVVSCNYRLGVLGGLVYDDGVTGNQ